MSNAYYNASTLLARHTLARSAAVNAALEAIASGFDSLPAPTLLKEARVTLGTVAGTANAITLALTSPISAYTAGLRVSGVIGTTNTGAATLNVDGQGARAIKRIDGEDIASGDLTAGDVAEFVYDGTNFVVTSPLRNYLLATGEKFLALTGGTLSNDLTVEGEVRTDGAAPSVAFYQTDQAANSRLTRFIMSGDDLLYQTANDDGSSPAIAFRFERAGGASAANSVVRRDAGDARYQLTSSQRFKTNITTTTAYSGVFDQLQPKQFVWGGDLAADDERVGQTTYGLIAEEVEDVFPEAIRYQWVPGDNGEDTATKRVQGLDAGALIAVLVDELKAVKARLDVLEAS